MRKKESKSGRKIGQTKKYPLKMYPVLLMLGKEEKDNYEKQASMNGYTLNVWLRLMLKDIKK